jgi:hypothetical protein
MRLVRWEGAILVVAYLGYLARVFSSAFPGTG